MYSASFLLAVIIRIVIDVFCEFSSIERFRFMFAPSLGHLITKVRCNKWPPQPLTLPVPSVWNSLPSGICACLSSSTSHFHRLLKTHCFKQAFTSPLWLTQVPQIRPLADTAYYTGFCLLTCLLSEQFCFELTAECRSTTAVATRLEHCVGSEFQLPGYGVWSSETADDNVIASQFTGGQLDQLNQKEMTRHLKTVNFAKVYFYCFFLLLA